MAAVSAQTAGEGVRSMPVFEDGLQLVKQGLTRMQETLDQQWQEALRRHEQRIQEALHRQKETLQSEFRQQMQEIQRQHEQRIQEALQTQERKLQSDYRQHVRDVQQHHEQNVQESLRTQEQRLQDDFRQQLQVVFRQQEQAKSLTLERKPEAVERPRPTSGGGGGENDGKRLEVRMQRLESYVEKALENVFPRVDALLSRLEKPSQPQTPFPTSLNSTSTEIPDPHLSPPEVPTSPRPSFAFEPPSAPDLVPRALKELAEAAEAGKADDVRRLLDAGVDVNTRVADGQTLLMLAAKGAHPSVVALLVQRKADVHAATANGNTALQFAAYSDRSGRCVALLVAAGADANSRDAKGFMPLHRAVSSENEAAVRELLKAGASRTAKDHVNCAPIDYAKNKAIRQILQF